VPKVASADKEEGEEDVEKEGEEDKEKEGEE
jgi:hypothetical protein